MQGKKIAKNRVLIWIFLFIVITTGGIYFIEKVYRISYWHRGLENNEVIFLGLLLASFIYILNKIINKISDCHSDYLDYCDMEDIKIKPIKETDKCDNNFNNEIWNNINRRAEKAKIVALSSLQFREIKDFVEKAVGEGLGIIKKKNE